MRRAFLLALLAAAAFALLPQVAAAGATDQQSSNWAGYAVSDAATLDGAPVTGSTTTLDYTSVTATWVEPKVTCDPNESSYSAFWVGLGGLAADASALEQTGTTADCNSGVPGYTAWYELVPAATTTVKLKVQPGDTITASVNVEPNGILMQLKDRTRKTSFTKLLATPTVVDYTSAEWIAEAPSSCDALLAHCRTLPLANFGTVPFTRIAAIANGHGGTVTDSTWSSAAIDLVPSSGTSLFNRLATSGKATPSPVDAAGRSFTVGFTT